ncbi:MAG: TSUP family transporter, partial [Clostridiales bacterium]|nr:TSUP family transporter [Candidatus Equinaster intestinalis]
GLFVSGGSFLAVYSVARLPEKREFRATVNAVWAIINTVMIITYFIDGMMTAPVLKMTGICILPTFFAVWLGGVLTKKVKQETFLKIIYVILILSGIVLFITNI